jgi:hypothetical protein
MTLTTQGSGEAWLVIVIVGIGARALERDCEIVPLLW